ncbi:MAG: undecaprenyldiphospho-muramoylpentapeptide beta-N-acetylglucosaminyltransferase [Thiovulaceae bacterium]|nr:undecaprenyldiphospho-muramoylpentapeptide beta-N-acetylglucosaminyltransferase [Sulfurimonadaceae bacterium]
MKKMTLAITGGGTGGHLVIAKALKESALDSGIRVIYLGSNYGQDRAWFEEDSDISSKYFFNTSGVVNKKGFKKILALFAIFVAVIKAFFILKKEQVDAVISVGGYSAAPASIASILRRKPFFIHEQNATIGKLNALLKPFSKGFFSSYSEPSFDYPVRYDFFDTARERDRVKNVIFLGGSQGAKAINELALQLAPKLQEMGIRIIHQSGKNDLERVQKEYADLGIDANVFAFSSHMPNLIAKTDFAIARSGASTVWEITANQLPTLFIPYPYAAKDHQAANAQNHVDQGACWMMREGEIDEAVILDLLAGSVKVQSQKLKTMLSPKGADMIISTIEKVYHGL